MHADSQPPRELLPYRCSTMPTRRLRFFLAGIMQGSHLGTALHGQD
ncbi:MAG TPA: hypothetical protein VNH11_06690 [Pirellulales bacterium]|nr:hypothetical protein [Pirellulales bacterium]